MKNLDTDEAIRKIVERLRDFAISRIILFGSSAEGSIDADSDLDLAVVVSSPNRFSSYDERLEMKSRIRAAVRDINRMIPIDILLYTESEFTELLADGGFLAEEVQAKGETIYEKAG
jgi:predicted nucleotidyltransferase